jgi:hypothetical protein
MVDATACESGRFRVKLVLAVTYGLNKAQRGEA